MRKLAGELALACGLATGLFAGVVSFGLRSAEARTADLGVNITTSSWRADRTVYITTSSWRADKSVYVAGRCSRRGSQDIYLTTSSWRADETWYVTTSSWRADMTICLSGDISEWFEHTAD